MTLVRYCSQMKMVTKLEVDPRHTWAHSRVKTLPCVRYAGALRLKTRQSDRKITSKMTKKSRIRWYHPVNAQVLREQFIYNVCGRGWRPNANEKFIKGKSCLNSIKLTARFASKSCHSRLFTKTKSWTSLAWIDLLRILLSLKVCTMRKPKKCFISSTRRNWTGKARKKSKSVAVKIVTSVLSMTFRYQETMRSFIKMQMVTTSSQIMARSSARSYSCSTPSFSQLKLPSKAHIPYPCSTARQYWTWESGRPSLVLRDIDVSTLVCHASNQVKSRFRTTWSP